MKKFPVNTHIHLTLTFQSTFQFHLYREKSAYPSEPQDPPEKSGRHAQVCLPYRTEPLYEDPQ